MGGWRRGRRFSRSWSRGSSPWSRIRREAFDRGRDTALEPPPEVVASDAVLLFDGIFLHRPELRAYWDFSLFLQVDFSISVPRALARDRSLPRDETRRVYATRYVPGQRLYLAEARPETRASLVIDNEDFAAPRIVRPA